MEVEVKQLEWSLLGRIFCITIVAIMAAANPLFAEEQDTQTLVGGNVDNGFFVAPDFKFTEVDGKFANLAGVYGGWFISRKLLLGGGGYFLTNRSDDFKMTYGGFVAEYFIRPSQLVHFSVKGLIGGGTATVSGFRGRFDDIFDELDDLPFEIPDNFRSRFGRGINFPSIPGFPGFPKFPGFPFPIFDDVNESFFVAEPEFNLNLNITEKLRVGFGGGYRFIAGAGRTSDRLDGFTANAALKIAF
jgi:hypothetical protein